MLKARKRPNYFLNKYIKSIIKMDFFPSFRKKISLTGKLRHANSEIQLDPEFDYHLLPSEK